MKSNFRENPLQFSEAVKSVAQSIRATPSTRNLHSPLILGVADAFLQFQDALAQQGILDTVEPAAFNKDLANDCQI